MDGGHRHRYGPIRLSVCPVHVYCPRVVYEWSTSGLRAMCIIFMLCMSYLCGVHGFPIPSQAIHVHVHVHVHVHRLWIWIWIWIWVCRHRGSVGIGDL